MIISDTFYFRRSDARISQRLQTCFQVYFDASLTKPWSVYWKKLNTAASALWKNGTGPSASKNSATADKGESSLRFREKLHGALSFGLGMYLAYKVYILCNKATQI